MSLEASCTVREAKGKCSEMNMKMKRVIIQDNIRNTVINIIYRTNHKIAKTIFIHINQQLRSIIQFAAILIEKQNYQYSILC